MLFLQPIVTKHKKGIHLPRNQLYENIIVDNLLRVDVRFLITLICRANALGMDVEWLPNGAMKTILGPRCLTKVFDGRKGRKMWFNTMVGMHGKEHSSALMADGTEIAENVVKRCQQIIEEESIQFKWEKGDVLFFDNYALLHGRRPSLPPRRVLVSTCK